MKLIKVIILLCLASSVKSQPAVKYSAVEISSAIEQLDVLGSVLYIAAHPDDENQAILAYMSKGKHFRSAYLSLTRGDGGQNLLGSEKGDMLGILRTQELLAARSIDGARQYFSRAIDFGYSKTAQETLAKWDRNLILGDVVHVIRQTRPDVIITRFSEQWGGHGHHIASAILAREAFDAAADPSKFPDQLKELEPWQARRLLWNTWRPAETENPIISIDLGQYNASRGESYREIAARSRTKHKTQGFGSTPSRGESVDYFVHTAGIKAEKDLFEDIDTSWKRVPGTNDIQESVQQLKAEFNPEKPAASIPLLINLYKTLQSQRSGYWIEIKKKEVKNLLQMCSGLWLESVASKESACPGDSIEIITTVLNRSAFKLSFEGKQITYSADSLFEKPLKDNKPVKSTDKILIPQDSEYSQPYWLKKPATETMFTVDSDFRCLAVEKPQLTTKVQVAFNDLTLSYDIPVEFKWNDPVNGEQYKPFDIEPELSISLSQNAYIFADNSSRNVTVTIEAHKDNISGTVDITLPQGWHKHPEKQSFSLNKKNEQQTVLFEVTAQKDAQNGTIKAQAFMDKKTFSQQLVRVDYDHIPQQNVLVPASAKIVKLDIVIPEKKIAYIMGSGDEIPQSLQQIGFSVDLLSDNDLQSIAYDNYDAVICGVRAFNTRHALVLQQQRILEYVQKGGVWIVQHNTRFGFHAEQIGPYPYVARGRSRISEEDAAITILQPAHPLMNYPNKISALDFDNWVQERGTYMAESWDENFIPLLSGNDQGEEPQQGGLLYSHYGKGVFIFTGFSWFRQLPAGVAGAYRIYVNMICAGDSNI